MSIVCRYHIFMGCGVELCPWYVGITSLWAVERYCVYGVLVSQLYGLWSGTVSMVCRYHIFMGCGGELCPWYVGITSLWAVERNCVHGV